MTTNLKATYPERTCFEGGRSKADFLCLLFHLLEENGVRYCVLHSWEALPGDLASDLDLALHPDDLKEVPYVFHALSSRGYHPLQGVKYALNGYRFDFIWFDTTTTVCVAVDITYGYVEGGLFLISGETLVNRRQRWGNFWIADPAVEFRYLLARTISKGTLADRHARRLTCLAKVVDRHIAECIAEDLFLRQLDLEPAMAATRLPACEPFGLQRRFPPPHQRIGRRNPRQFKLARTLKKVHFAS